MAKKIKNTKILQSLIGLKSTSKFIKDQLIDNIPLVTKSSSLNLKKIIAIKELNSIENLLNACEFHNAIDAWTSSAKGKNYSSVKASKALLLYKNGYTIYIQGIEKVITRLQPIIRKLEIELGLFPNSICCEVFASPKGAGAQAHFDPNSGFNIQLKGEKAWEFASNSFVSLPHVGYSVLHKGFSPELNSYSKPLPSQMPTPELKFSAKVGSVIFVPHGAWHRTMAQSESLALVITIQPITWGQAIFSRIQKELISLEQSRNFVSLHKTKELKLRNRKNIQIVSKAILEILKNTNYSIILNELKNKNN